MLGVILVLLVGYLVLGTGWKASFRATVAARELHDHDAGPSGRGHPLAQLQAPTIGLDKIVVEGSGGCGA